MYEYFSCYDGFNSFSYSAKSSVENGKIFTLLCLNQVQKILINKLRIALENGSFYPIIPNFCRC